MPDGSKDSGRIVFSHTGLWPPVRHRRWWIKQPHLLRYHPRYSPDDIWVSARSGDLVIKYRHDGAGQFIYEAFDVAKDPQETHDIYDPKDPPQRALVSQLDEYRQVLIRAHVDPRKREEEKDSPQTDEILMKQLRALGYID
jgi:hypothetical protein